MGLELNLSVHIIYIKITITYRNRGKGKQAHFNTLHRVTHSSSNLLRNKKIQGIRSCFISSIFWAVRVSITSVPTCSWLLTWIFSGYVPRVCSLNPSSTLWQTSTASKKPWLCFYCNPNSCTSLSVSVLRREPGRTKAGNGNEAGCIGVLVCVCVCVYDFLPKASFLQFCRHKNYTSLTFPVNCVLL